MKIFLTGATGFLGSHIAEALFLQGIDLMLTRRKSSVLDKCSTFVEHVNWIYTDDDNWVEQAIEFCPDIILHAAWNGVESSKRDEWEVQLSNISFLYQLLKIAKEANIQKFISLGSQAEYGQFNEKVTEEFKITPVGSYAVVKLACLEYLKAFCIDNSIAWYWLRVFSVLGKNDQPTWLLPTVIVKLNSNESIELSAGDQSYDYMFIEDFNERILQVINGKLDNSGVYNLCTGRPTKIKDFLTLVAEKMNKPIGLLKFGALPYRSNQSMHMIGDCSKFDTTFGTCKTTSIEYMLDKIIY